MTTTSTIDLAALAESAHVPNTNGVYGNQSKPKLQSYRLSELYSKQFPDPVWVVPEYLPEGQALLIARPKIGKSWMALQLCAAVGSGEIFLGQRVQRAPVLYLALEDRERRMNDRARKQAISANADIEIIHQWESFMATGASELMKMVESGGYKLVVVDTLQRAFSGFDLVKHGAIVAQRMAVLQEWALSNHVAMLFIHHSRKSSTGDVVDDAIGATQIAGNADALWQISRQRGQRDAKFQITGRDVDERELAIRFDVQLWCWQSLGNAEDVVSGEQRIAIIRTIETMGAPTHKEIVDATGQQRENCFKRLQDLLAAGKIKIVANTKPARFTLATTSTTATTTAIPYNEKSQN